MKIRWCDGKYLDLKQNKTIIYIETLAPEAKIKLIYSPKQRAEADKFSKYCLTWFSQNNMPARPRHTYIISMQHIVFTYISIYQSIFVPLVSINFVALDCRTFTIQNGFLPVRYLDPSKDTSNNQVHARFKNLSKIFYYFLISFSTQIL